LLLPVSNIFALANILLTGSEPSLGGAKKARSKKQKSKKEKLVRIG